MASGSSGPPVTDVVVGTGEIWAPFVSLVRLIDRTVETPSREGVAGLKSTLDRFQLNFRTLLNSRVSTRFAWH